MVNQKINMKQLFSALDEEMKMKLSSKIDQIYHPTAKGNETELNWLGLLKNYLPARYKVDTGFVVDCKGNISEQIDIIIYDRHFTPFIFKGENTLYIPAEGVYAVFEVKPELTKKYFDYAIKKLKSVQNLNRTSVNFTHIKGNDKKELFSIEGGILTTRINSKNIFTNIELNCDLSIILVLNYGIKIINQGCIDEKKDSNFLSFFLLKLIEKLRVLGSVPALDTNAYLKSIENDNLCSE